MEPAFRNHLRSLCYAGPTMSLPAQGLEWLRSQYLRHGLPTPSQNISAWEVFWRALRPLYYRIGEPLTQATPISQVHTVYALAVLGDEAGLEMLKEDYGLLPNLYMEAYSRGLRKGGAGVQAVQILEAYFSFSTYQGLLEKAMVAVARLGLQERFLELLAQLRVCPVPSRLRRLGCLESAFYLETLGTQYLHRYPPLCERFYQDVIQSRKPPSDAVFEHLLVLFQQGRVRLSSFILSTSLTAAQLERVLEVHQRPLMPCFLDDILLTYKELPKLRILLNAMSNYVPPLRLSEAALKFANAAAVTYSLQRYPELTRIQLVNFKISTRGTSYVDLPYVNNDKALFAQYGRLLQRLVSEVYHRGHVSLQSRLVLDQFSPEVRLSFSCWIRQVSGTYASDLGYGCKCNTSIGVIESLQNLVFDQTAWPALLALGLTEVSTDNPIGIRELLLNSLIFCATHQPSYQLARLVSLSPSYFLKPILNELTYACCLYNRPDNLQLLMDYFPDAFHQVEQWETVARGCGHAELLEFVMSLPVGLRLGLEDVD